MSLRFQEVSVGPGAPHVEALVDVIHAGMYADSLITPADARSMHFGPDTRHFILLDDEDTAVAAAGGLQDVGQAELCKLDYLVVHPGRQGQGLGRLVLASLEDVARVNGATVLTLDLLPTSDAGPFYERLGYVQDPVGTFSRPLDSRND